MSSEPLAASAHVEVDQETGLRLQRTHEASDGMSWVMPRSSSSVRVLDNRTLMLKMKNRARRVRHRAVPFIVPSSPSMVLYKAVLCVGAAYSICEVPFRIAFVPAGAQSITWLIMNGVVDAVFAINILVSFVTAYKAGDSLITNPKLIVEHYTRTLFVPDVLSTLCGICDILEASRRFPASLRTLNLLRMLRVFQLASFRHFAGGLQALRFLERMNPAVLRLFLLLAQIIFIAHLIACFWFHVNSCETAFGQNLAGASLCPESYDPPKCTSTCGEGHVLSQYLASLYWTMATMMAVGYGDVVADTTSERLYAMFTQLVGAICFGVIIATITNILETLNPCETAKHEKMEEMMRFVAEKEVSVKLQRRIRRHLSYYFNARSAFSEADVLRGLPDHMRWQVTFFTRSSFIDKLSLSRRVDIRLVISLAARMHPMRFDAGEVITQEGNVSEEMFFVRSGTVCATKELPETRKDASSVTHGARTVRVLVGVFREGDDFELDSVLNRQFVSATYRAVTDGEAFWLPQRDLWACAAKDPEFFASLWQQCGLHQTVLELVLKSGRTQRGSMASMKSILLGSQRTMPLARIDKLLPTLLEGGSLGVRASEHLVRTCRLRPGIAAGQTWSLPALLWRRQLPIAASSGSMRAVYSVSSHASSARTAAGAASAASETTGSGSTALPDRYVEAAETSRALWERFIIDPTHDSKIFWDLFIGLLTITSVILVPLEMAFELNSTAWVVTDTVFTSLFLLDMCLSFRTAFLNENGIYDTIPTHIAACYLRTWFVVDFLSSFPFEAVFAGTRAAKLTRLIRLFRILKLFRLFKLKRLSLPDFILDLDVTVTKGVKLTCILFFIAHIFGCFWNYISTVDGDRSRTWWTADGLSESDMPGRYVAGVYWAITTMTTVGYGDILPMNDVEKLFATVFMLVGATVFGYIVGSVSTLARNPHGVAARTGHHLNMVSNYLKEQHHDFHTRRSVRRTLHFALQRNTPFDEAILLQILPHTLRQSLVLESAQDVVTAIPFMRHQPNSVVALIVRNLKPLAFQDKDVVCDCADGSDGVYTVVEGVVERIHDVAAEVDAGVLDDADIHELQLSVCYHRPGSCFGYNGFVGVPEDDNVYMVARGECKIYALLANAVAELVDVHPMAVRKIQEGIAGMHEEQSELIRSEVELHRSKVEGILASLDGALHRQKTRKNQKR